MDTSFANFSCSTTIPLEIPRRHLIIWVIFSFILSLWSITSNSVLIYALHKTIQLKNATGKFLAAMSLSDLLLGFAIFPMVIAIILMKLNGGKRNCALEIVTRYFGMGSIYFSGFMLLAVAYDRYLHVSKLMRYHEFMTSCRMKSIIVASIVASNIPMVTALFVPAIYFQVIILVVDITAITAICILYKSVLKRVRSHSLRIRKISQSESEKQQKLREKRDLSVTKAVRTLLFIMLVLYGPYHISTTAQAYFEYLRPQKYVYLKYWLDIAEYLSIILITSTACVNSTVFCFYNSRIKRFLSHHFCCRKETISFENEDSSFSKPKETPEHVEMNNNPGTNFTKM